MRRRAVLLTAIVVVLGALGSGLAIAGTSGEESRATEAKKRPLQFADSDLFIEINATDGDAGLQMSLDGEEWRAFSLFSPSGHKILDIRGTSTLRGYGLTGLTFESAEPPFDEVPFSKFKKRFPEGKYVFRGVTVDGRRLKGSDRLTHDIPRMPTVTSPLEDAVVAAESFVVTWQPVTKPSGIEIVEYQVIVSAEDRDGTIEAVLPPEATRMSIPPEFLLPGSYKVEVIAKETSGNQVITEIPFAVE